MRCRVIASHSIDGVAPGGEVEVRDNEAVRGMILAGLLEPLEELPASPPAPTPGERLPTEEEVARTLRHLVEYVERMSSALDALAARVERLEARGSKKAPAPSPTDPAPSEG